MKLEKAIEILTELTFIQYHSGRNADVVGSDWANALKLGIEALKFIKGWREGLPQEFYSPLPGETEVCR